MRRKLIRVAAATVAAGVFAGGVHVPGPARAVAPGVVLLAAGQRPYEEVTRDLHSPDPAVRVAAMRALAVASYPESMAPIATLLTDQRDDIQLEAIDTLLSFVVVDRFTTTRRVALVVEVKDKQRPEAVFDAGPFVLIPRPVVPEVVTGLAAAMRDDSERVRVDATYALGVLARPGVDAAGIQALVTAMGDPEKKVRLAAVRVAGALRAEGAGDAIINAINDKQPEVRTAAMRAIGDVRDERAVPALTEQFEFYERKGPYAEAAFDGLARIGSARSTPVFQEQLTSRSRLMRRYAAEGLARSGQASLSRPTLESCVGAEKEQDVALACAYALQSVGRPAVDRLVAALSQRSLAPVAMLYLTELGPPVAGPLGAYLQSPDAATREAVAMVLGVVGGADAIAALDRAKQDPDTDVARAVERAIARARMGR